MSVLPKIVLGALATTALSWLFHGPMKFGQNCPAGAAAVSSTNTVANTTPTNVVATNVTTPAPAVSAASQACQGTVTSLMSGKTINFETGSANIAGSSQGLVDQLADAVKGCKDVAVEVGGHTDSRGNDASNQSLSERRAQAVVSALTAKGVAAGQITAKGYGETKPLDPAETPEALAKNRRIEFTVTAAPAAANPAG